MFSDASRTAASHIRYTCPGPQSYLILVLVGEHGSGFWCMRAGCRLRSEGMGLWSGKFWWRGRQNVCLYKVFSGEVFSEMQLEARRHQGERPCHFPTTMPVALLWCRIQPNREQRLSELPWWSRTKGFPGGSAVKNPPANAGDTGLIPGSGRSPEKEMATHSSTLAWEIPRTEEPGGQQSTGLRKNQIRLKWLNSSSSRL